MSEGILTVGKSNFEEMIIHSSLPIMLVFWSPNYINCNRLIETVESLALRYRGSIRFGLVDVDKECGLTDQLGIGGLPCVLVIQNGRLCANIGGDLPLSHYKRLIDKLLAESKANHQKAKKH